LPHAIRIYEPGGPEVLRWEEVAVGDPGPGEVRLRHRAVGLNYIDVYHRTGLYPQPLPFTPGMEGAGEIVALGAGVTGLSAGDRVAYANPIGSYAEERLIPAERLVPLPEDIDDETAAAIMLQGMTAEYLVRRTYPVGPGTTLLFHAAAGGVGLIACQWAAHLGATVIGTVGSEEKAALARANGCRHVIDYRRENFAQRVKDITDGRGVDVVYDGVGRDTFPASLDALRPRGLWVSFGQASGALPPIQLSILSEKGSLFATRPTLYAYVATRGDLLGSAGALFDMVRSGAVRVRIGQTYGLADAARAHADLEARRTTGSTVLIP
jgi:NADPH2:quinone reductase